LHQSAKELNPLDKISPTVFVEGAREWLGAPFLIGGRSKHGVDCASFLLQTALKLGVIDHYDPKPYGIRQLRDRDFLVGHIRRFCDRVEKHEVGDVLVLQLGPQVCHCGLKSTETRYIHVERDNGCVEVTLSESRLRRIAEIYRPRFYWQP
jgi:cell wall-associated NlpC family hydrolase